MHYPRLAGALIILTGSTLAATGTPAPKPEEPPWIRSLGYQPGEVRAITLNLQGIPRIVIKVDDAPLTVLFDTGCSGPLVLTTAVEKDIRFESLRQSEELNPDGSHRGWSREIKLAKVDISGTAYGDVEATLVDWRLMSSLPFSGLVGLSYFPKKRLTLDYRNRLLAVTDRPLPESALGDPGLAVVPLLKGPVKQGEIIYVEGEVNGHKQVIYLDTGAVPSCVSPEAAAGSETSTAKFHNVFGSDRKYKSIEVKLGRLTFRVEDIYESRNIRRGTSFEYPVGLILGSDELKGLILTIDKIGNRLVVSRPA